MFLKKKASSVADYVLLNPWDFYDVNNNNNVDLSDTLVVLAHFGHTGYFDALDNKLDRYSPIAAQKWRTAEANNGVDLVDALASLQSFGHVCAP